MYLLRDVEKYLRISDISPTRSGRDVMGDPRFVHDLRRGIEEADLPIGRRFVADIAHLGELVRQEDGSVLVEVEALTIED